MESSPTRDGFPRDDSAAFSIFQNPFRTISSLWMEGTDFFHIMMTYVSSKMREELGTDGESRE